MDNQYPIVKIPSFLHESNLFLDKIPLPIEPSEPVPPKLRSKFPWILLIYIVLGMPLISSGFGIVGFVASILLLFVIINITSKKEENTTRLAIIKYEEAQQVYIDKMDEHNNKMKIFNKRLSEEFVYMENPLLRILKIQMTKIEFLASAKQPEDCSDGVKKGVSEKYFYTYLKSVFGDHILINKTLWDYTPDFIFFHPFFKLFIDIEIDEPYDALSREPIHYIGEDFQRDNYFVKNKWCVIRFSEKQVIQQALPCCCEIKRVVNTIFPSAYGKEDLTEILLPDKRWTREDAIIMAKENYRDSYLKNL